MSNLEAMPGNNTITLCQAAVQEAIRYWLEHVHLKTPPVVTALKVEDPHSCAWTLTVVITDEVPK